MDFVNSHRKKIIGVAVGALLAVLGAVFGVDLSGVKPSITDQVEQAVVTGQAHQQLGGFTFGRAP